MKKAIFFDVGCDQPDRTTFHTVPHLVESSSWNRLEWRFPLRSGTDLESPVRIAGGPQPASDGQPFHV